MSQLPASAVRTLRAQSARTPMQRAAAALGPVAVPAGTPVAPPAPPAEPHDLNIIGPRKLIRPTLPARALQERRFSRREEPALSWRSAAPPATAAQESSHAEAFYFQKQVQAQTPMVFVLEDGEKIEGCIEWYDRNAIKVRCSGSSGSWRTGRPGEGITRVLIYKAGIKYLYKAGENQPQI